MHRTLVLSNQLQLLPPSLVTASMVFNSGLATLFWLGGGALAPALIVGAGVFVASLTNWALLRRLPRQGRSFGPDQPAALALSAVQALTAVVLGLLGASLGLTLVVLALISVLAYYTTWVEPFSIALTRERIQARGWQAECAPLRLIHLSDLHVERTSLRERRVNALVASLQPDVIVFSGDFVNLSYRDDAQAAADVRGVIGAWQAPLGVYVVPGTPAVEPLARVVEFVEGQENLTLLANRWTSIETRCGPLHILGLITTHDLKPDRETLAKQMASAPQGGFRLLLVHAPDIAPEAAEAGFDLYLCGHTHGGQIRLPLIGALATASHYGRRFASGRVQVGQMVEYTSRGIGLEGLGAPRARLLCPPEVILWEIFPSP